MNVTSVYNTSWHSRNNTLVTHLEIHGIYIETTMVDSLQWQMVSAKFPNSHRQNTMIGITRLSTRP